MTDAIELTERKSDRRLEMDQLIKKDRSLEVKDLRQVVLKSINISSVTAK